MMWELKIRLAGNLLPWLDAILPADLRAGIERLLGFLSSRSGQGIPNHDASSVPLIAKKIFRLFASLEPPGKATQKDCNEYE